MLLLTGLLISANVLADVKLTAIFGSKVMLTIDGKNHMLAQGESSPEGYTLLAIRDGEVTLRYQGESLVVHLGEGVKIQTQYAAPEQPKVVLLPTGNGMYRTRGQVNGKTIEFVVDTGATTVALNARHAHQLGIDFKRIGTPVRVATASRVEWAYQVRLDRVKVGQIELFNVQAAVMDNLNFPSHVLLGMSFLGQLEMLHLGNRLELRQKW